MATNIIYGDFIFPGDVSLTGTATLPTVCVTDASVSTTANLTESKLQHRHFAKHSQPSAAVVAVASDVVYIAYTTATVLGVRIGTDTVPTGGDLAYTVDVKKSTAGGAWATILTGVYTINSGKTSRTVYSGTLSGTPTLIASDMLQVVIAVSGSTGTQGYGVCVEVIVAENGV